MKNIFTILAVFFFTFSFSQEIKLNKSATKFEKDGVTYKLSEYKTQFTNLVAKDYISNGRSSRTLANILGFGGGLLIGAGLPNALSSNKDSVYIDPYTAYSTKIKTKKPGWTLVGIGLGVVAVAIPFSVVGNKKIRKGVETENKFESSSNANFLQFNVNDNGIGWSYNF